MTKTASLQTRLLAFLGGARASFEALALEVFAFQFEHNLPFRAFCELKQRTPDTVADWREIPAVPTRSFKDLPIICFPAAEAVAEFHTSGTTRALAGKHFFKTLALYDAGSVPWFNAHLFPDGNRLPILSLVPETPHSSLAHMCRTVGGRYVEQLEVVTEPVCLLGTAFHFLNLLDAGLELRLPPGSRAMETGGFKGRSREISKPELYALFEQHLGIPATHVVNEYGMTELSTQFYDQTLRIGRQTDTKFAPPWARVLITDPTTGEEVPAGTRGLIRVFDLANLWSAMCVQTEDWGVATGDGGFAVLGRATSAEVRGCSLNAEALAGA
jgi:hypothetical protein